MTATQTKMTDEQIICDEGEAIPTPFTEWMEENNWAFYDSIDNCINVTSKTVKSTKELMKLFYTQNMKLLSTFDTRKKITLLEYEFTKIGLCIDYRFDGKAKRLTCKTDLALQLFEVNNLITNWYYETGDTEPTVIWEKQFDRVDCQGEHTQQVIKQTTLFTDFLTDFDLTADDAIRLIVSIESDKATSQEADLLVQEQLS